MARIKIGNVYPTDDYLLKRCAPAGFGLGTFSTLLTKEDDLNDIRVNGWYHWERDSVPANVPTLEHTSYMTSMRVWTNVGNVFCQELMDMTDSVSGGAKLRRFAYVNKFYEWEWINPPCFSGKEYRTTEKFNGEPVYTSLISFGIPTSSPANKGTGIMATKVIRSCGHMGGNSLPYINGTLDNATSAWANAKVNNDSYIDVDLHFGSGMNGKSAEVQVWYTKT
jgi:hypothetical protein